MSLKPNKLLCQAQCKWQWASGIMWLMKLDKKHLLLRDALIVYEDKKIKMPHKYVRDVTKDSSHWLNHCAMTGLYVNTICFTHKNQCYLYLSFCHQVTAGLHSQEPASVLLPIRQVLPHCPQLTSDSLSPASEFRTSASLSLSSAIHIFLVNQSLNLPLLHTHIQSSLETEVHRALTMKYKYGRRLQNNRNYKPCERRLQSRGKWLLSLPCVFRPCGIQEQNWHRPVASSRSSDVWKTTNTSHSRWATTLPK